MRYFLNDLRRSKTYELGSTPNEVIYGLLHLREYGFTEWYYYSPLAPQTFARWLKDRYNETGKDTMPEFNYKGCWDKPMVTYPLRPILVTDENGRHISFDTLKEWMAAYVHPESPRYYWIGWRHYSSKSCTWPSLLARDNKALDDRDSLDDIRELAGSRYEGLLDRPLVGWHWGWDVKEPGERGRQAEKSWKRKKCRHQWQKHKPGDLTYRRKEKVGEPLEDILARMRLQQEDLDAYLEAYAIEQQRENDEFWDAVFWENYCENQ